MSTPTGTFLTQQEIRELTGYTVKLKQIEWLTGCRWPFELDRFKRPVVLRSVMECKLGVPDTDQDGFILDEASVA